jgi:hypothetical protein
MKTPPLPDISIAGLHPLPASSPIKGALPVHRSSPHDRTPIFSCLAPLSTTIHPSLSQAHVRPPLHLPGPSQRAPCLRNAISTIASDPTACTANSRHRPVHRMPRPSKSEPTTQIRMLPKEYEPGARFHGPANPLASWVYSMKYTFGI